MIPRYNEEDGYQPQYKKEDHPEPVLPNHPTSRRTMTFYDKDNEVIGELDYDGPELKFTGKAEESAQVFLRALTRAFAARLEQERKQAVEDYISKRSNIIRAKTSKL